VIHGCTVGNRCLIGIGSIVLDGVVERFAVVARHYVELQKGYAGP
jgi:carbonic anhydrase/acetyltransferase-like protein (isoleucine patch superfamily)